MEKASPDPGPKLPGPVFLDAQESPPARRRGILAWLFAPIDRWLSAPGHSDPLHVTNRTLGQKLRVWAAVAAGVAAVGGTVYYIQSVHHRADTVAPQAELSPAEIAKSMLPNLDKVQLENAAIRTVDARIVHGARTELEGTVQNGSTHKINGAEITFEIADEIGSKLGSVVVQIGPLGGA
jgi:hypothetical protein